MKVSKMKYYLFSDFEINTIGFRCSYAAFCSLIASAAFSVVLCSVWKVVSDGAVSVHTLPLFAIASITAATLWTISCKEFMAVGKIIKRVKSETTFKDEGERVWNRDSGRGNNPSAKVRG